MTEEKGYQGWTNYETWATSLWIDNEEPLYREARKMARGARRKAAEQIEDGDKFPREARFILADALKEWVEGMAPDLGATLFSDLLNAALSAVDWLEIADAYFQEKR